MGRILREGLLVSNGFVVGGNGGGAESRVKVVDRELGDESEVCDKTHSCEGV
jgi:hypothetical protein